jgi:alpha-mannosidase
MLVTARDIAVPGMSAVVLRSKTGSASPAAPFLTVTSRQIENDDLRISVKPDGTLESIYDKTFDREVLADRGNQLWLFTDVPRQFDAWDIDATYTDEGTELLAALEPESVEPGPIRGALKVVRRYEDIEIVQEYRLAAYSRRLEIATRIKWHGRRRLLRAHP